MKNIAYLFNEFFLIAFFKKALEHSVLKWRYAILINLLTRRCKAGFNSLEGAEAKSSSTPGKVQRVKTWILMF